MAVPILAIISPFAFLIVKKWMDFRLRLAEAHGASDVARRLADAEAAFSCVAAADRKTGGCRGGPALGRARSTDGH